MLFWGLLTFYMAILVIWNWLLGLKQVQWHPRWIKWVQPVLVVAFAAMAVLTWCAAELYDGGWVELVAVLRYLRWVVLIAVLAYLVPFKRYLSNVLD